MGDNHITIVFRNLQYMVMLHSHLSAKINIGGSKLLLNEKERVTKLANISLVYDGGFWYNLYLPEQCILIRSERYAVKGYKNKVVHVTFLKVLHNCRFLDLRQKNHIFHPTRFNIAFTLPVVVRRLQRHKFPYCRSSKPYLPKLKQHSRIPKLTILSACSRRRC